MSDSTPKFRVGDIIRCIDAHPGFSGQPGHNEIGKLYTVRKLSFDGSPMIFESDEKHGIGWNPERFELVDDATAHMHGDTFIYDASPGTVTLTDTTLPYRATLINSMTQVIHQANVAAGWYTNLATGEPLDRKMMEVELADAVIRIFDLAGYCGYDLGGAIEEKLLFNASREDHKIENRKAEGGKKF